MPEYTVPGVYIEESSSPPRPIEGVDTRTTGFLGNAERGMVRPTRVSSFGEFERSFGGDAGSASYLPFAVRGFFENGGARCYICRIASRSATIAEAVFGPHYKVQAIGPGAWGGRIFVRIDDATRLPGGFRLRVAYWASEPTSDPREWFDGTSDSPAPDVAEDFDDLAVEASSPDHWAERLASSVLVRLVAGADAPSDASPTRGFSRLDSGDDGAAIDVRDFEGDSSGETGGLAALAGAPYADVSLVCAPGCPVDVARALIDHCEAMRYRLAILDAPPELPAEYDPRDAIADSSYAALYAPWLVVSDPRSPEQQWTVPPSGHVAGVFARVDAERGVHKAPANEEVRGVVGLATAIGHDLQEALNSRSVNAIRGFPGKGPRVWGARTLSSDAQWKYVNVRRLLIFIERSIDVGTQWVVFEPNAEPTWKQVTGAASRFLLKVWRDGALLGSKPEQAFFVRCDHTTMTQNDIDDGRLICVVGVAPVKPAEFIILRFAFGTR